MLQIVPFPLVNLILVGTLILVGVTLAFFAFVYVVMWVYATMNPWVDSVKQMNRCCNPAFSMWYFEHHRHKWVAYSLAENTFFALAFWWFFMILNRIYYIPPYGELAYNVTFATSLTLGILLLIALGYALVRYHASK